MQRFSKMFSCLILIIFPIIIIIIHCSPFNTDNEYSRKNNGEFTLVSITPPLNATLVACDTIIIKFYYKLPENFDTKNSVFIFDLKFRADSQNKKPTISPEGCYSDSKNWQDTITIKCPVQKILNLSIVKNPVEMTVSMITIIDCYEVYNTPTICLNGINYPEKYNYHLDSNYTECKK